MPLPPALRPKRKQVKMAVSKLFSNLRTSNSRRTFSVPTVRRHARGAMRLVLASDAANTAPRRPVWMGPGRSARRESSVVHTGERARLAQMHHLIVRPKGTVISINVTYIAYLAFPAEQSPAAAPPFYPYFYQPGFVPLGADGQPMQPDPNGQSGLHPPHPPPYYPLHPAYPPFVFPPGAGYPMMGHLPGMASPPHSHAGPSGEIMNGEGEASGSRKDGDASPPRKKKHEA